MGGRGTLRVYLGAAPGVGKTFAMLDEGHRRRERGADVVIGVVETHERPKTAEKLGDLEVVPRRHLRYRDREFEEMDVDAVVARRPDVVLVDELAHTNVEGSRHAKRWQDVEALLDAGIDVISTLNIQHLESLNDVVEKITGVAQRETVPDAVVRAADQIELVDMSPEALRRRMAHGNIYKPERIDAALANYFRPGNLGALRELALLWAADRVEDSLADYRSAHGITDTWETRERVVVAVTGAPGGDMLVRRAARIAQRARGELVGVHVTTTEGLRAAGAPAALGEQVALIGALGGTFVEVAADDVGRALVDVARARGATQLVLGASRRSRLATLVRGSVIVDAVRRAGGIDVHVIARDDDGIRPAARHRAGRSPLSPRRQVTGWAIVALLLPVLTALLVAHADAFSLATDLLLFLLAVVVAGAVGGPWPGVSGAVIGSLLVNWYLVPPVHTFTVGEAENVLALLVFVAVAIVVTTYVHLSAQRTLEARRARAETESLAFSAGMLASTGDPIPAMLEQLVTVVAAEGAVVRGANGGPVIAHTGATATGLPTAVVEVTPEVELAVVGRALDARDQNVLRSHADQLAVALRERELVAHAAQASVAREADELRTALLRAVSHDLRTPLAGIKASVTSLLSRDVDWSVEQRDEFLATIDAEADRLNRLVGNLLDMSRLQAGVLSLRRTVTIVDDVIANALTSLPSVPPALAVRVPEDLPLLDTDPDLLERAVANVIGNALAWSPEGAPIAVTADAVGSRVHVRVVDRGPGIAEGARRAATRPFQRLGDASDVVHPQGVGLGLAVASGFVRALDGELTLEDTPGGGLTVVIDLPALPAREEP